MFLMTETISNDIEILTEEVNGKKELYLKGVFLEYNRKNRNGRSYPKSILEREMTSYNSNFITTNRSYGELSHPQSSEINPDRISHIVTEINDSGSNFTGTAKLLDTPCGSIVKGIVEGGGQFGISSRGMGTVKMHNGINEVQSDYDFVCLDLVVNPSGIDCFVQMVMENEVWIPKTNIVEVQDVIKGLSSKELNANKLKTFEFIMANLS